MAQRSFLSDFEADFRVFFQGRQEPEEGNILPSSGHSAKSNPAFISQNNVLKVVLQKSIPAQIRQLILYIRDSK